MKIIKNGFDLLRAHKMAQVTRALAENGHGGGLPMRGYFVVSNCIVLLYTI
ncbi:hypothetical protein LJC56_10165 [Christensenellaceae bacterium OttesenSCG-928-K19]|nr:hypothetical protein [Christensenellaceae bacterium OttesenSCG-928-K19]